MYLAAGGNENRAIVWDISETSAPKFLFTIPHLAAVKALHFCPWSSPPTLLATAGGLNDCSVKIWHVPLGSLIKQFFTSGQITSVTWLKYLRQLAVTFGYRFNSTLGAAVVYKYPDFTLVSQVLQKELRVFSCAVSTDQTRIAVTSQDGTVILFPLWERSAKVKAALDLPTHSPPHTANDFESSIIQLMEGIDAGFALR